MAGPPAARWCASGGASTGSFLQVPHRANAPKADRPDHSFHRGSKVRTAGREPQKSADALAQAIEAEIIESGWPVGRWLGSEPHLIEKYGVSRMVMREAIRILEHHMTAQMRRGAGGGLVVTAPDASVVTEAAALYLDFKRANPQHLYNSRSALELKCVELVTAALDEDKAAHLQGLIDEEASFTVRDVLERGGDTFHRELAELTGDPALVLFIGVLSRLTVEWAPETDHSIAVGGAQVLKSRDDHAAIVAAMLRGDVDSASALMEQHLAWITTGMEPHTMPAI